MKIVSLIALLVLSAHAQATPDGDQPAWDRRSVPTLELIAERLFNDGDPKYQSLIMDFVSPMVAATLERDFPKTFPADSAELQVGPGSLADGMVFLLVETGYKWQREFGVATVLKGVFQSEEGAARAICVNLGSRAAALAGLLRSHEFAKKSSPDFSSKNHHSKTKSVLKDEYACYLSQNLY